MFPYKMWGLVSFYTQLAKIVNFGGKPPHIVFHNINDLLVQMAWNNCDNCNSVRSHTAWLLVKCVNVFSYWRGVNTVTKYTNQADNCDVSFYKMARLVMSTNLKKDL